MNEVLLKFIKFCTVGGSGVIVDFRLTYLCKEKFRLNKYLPNSIGFMIAASSNYILNRIWTFDSINQDIKTEYLSFIFVSTVGLLINNLTLWVVHKKMKFNFYLSKIGAIGVVTIWNFLANYSFTFGHTFNIK